EIVEVGCGSARGRCMIEPKLAVPRISIGGRTVEVLAKSGRRADGTLGKAVDQPLHRNGPVVVPDRIPGHKALVPAIVERADESECREVEKDRPATILLFDADAVGAAQARRYAREHAPAQRGTRGGVQ